ncbi:serine/arginine repetitive matrix protein 1 isoform X2 [Fundulus heteroclitus]|uniref:serine/arginine repetitive matrix protein 1 isoform X2 n=1 Tax=Fundulus heteroclitus TaxID=8078 RepID=UPI00165C1A99|nr:serine/arginine repetitive matrix protein 1 isoform X2 [Fundulus heteroclitus]
MDKFFKPVHSPSSDQTKKQRNPHHHPHHHHQDTHSQRYTKLDDNVRNSDDSRGPHRRRQHSEILYDSPHHDAQYLYQQDNEKLYDHHTSVTLSRASSSSLSSTSSSSSTSWFTETSANDPFYLQHAERPQHSLSCSNISEVRRGFREDDGSEPIVFATVKHSKKGNVVSSSHQSRGNDLYDLNRGHSRSEEGLLQCNESDGGRGRPKASKIDHGPLYKTTSLNRSLAFSEENIVLGVPRGPKRAVSSSQLPSKGILKNKENNNDIRKAKSMEVLSPRVKTGEGQSGVKGKGITEAEIQRARATFVEGKLQFSAFLDEITKQVMSPSQLSIFGVSPNKTTEKTFEPVPKPEPVKPELPPKKHRAGRRSDTELPVKKLSRQVKPPIGSRKHSDCSDSDKLTTYAGRRHQGSPPPSHFPPSASHGRKDRRPSPTGDSMSGDRYSRYGPPHTDGTSTSPEPNQPKQRHHRRQHPDTFKNQNPYIQNFTVQTHHEGEHRRPSNSPPSSSQAAGQGFGSESSSTKSDSSRGRDTASTATSHSSEQSARHQSQHMGISQTHRNMVCDPDHLQALQEENADLHQNLLQTVVCIESLEAELQRTRDELSHVKEKYKSLLQTHSGTKQANNLLGEHLHKASESLSSERKYLQNRVSQLGSELDDAHRTIAALENINKRSRPFWKSA